VVLSLPAVALTSWRGRARGFSSRDLGYGAVAGCGGWDWLLSAVSLVVVVGGS
jgi:hypothetical protein